ncbi:MAG: glycosyltransferase family 2 protein [Armatimonadota bacterium]
MRLTVIVPTYNRSGLLERCLRGLLNQTAAASEYEIVVVDDGSTDGTAEVAEEVARLAGSGDPGLQNGTGARVRHFRQENKGPAAARNLGVLHARGEIVLFTGDDCLPDGRLIEEHLRAHEQAGDVGVLGLVTWHPEIEITPFMAYLESGPQFGFNQIADPENVSIWHFYTSNCSVQRHRIEQVGGFDEEFGCAAFEDVEIAYRMKQRGLRIVYRPEAKTYHHHPTTFEQHLARQRLTGKSAALFYHKHPELKVELGIAHSARMTTALKFWEAATEYAFALGVREGLTGEAQPGWGELEALSSDPKRAEAGRMWVREVFGTVDPDKLELVELRAEMERMKKEWGRVTSRRLYRWCEGIARGGWKMLRRLGVGRRPGRG